MSQEWRRHVDWRTRIRGLRRLAPVGALTLVPLFAGCSDLLDTGPQWTPVDMEQVAAGALHTCALDVDGEAYCWGQNDLGQLGRGTFGGTAFAPEPVMGPSFTHLDAGARYNCGLTAPGEVYCWGSNLEGQLGNPEYAGDPLAAVPVRVSGEGPFAGLATGDHHACALDQDGRVHCWGLNLGGEVGLPADSAVLVSPQPVETGVRFTALTAGWAHTCGLTEGGETWCWGDNELGQLGDGSTTPSHEPRRTAAGTLVKVAAGAVHTCGIGVDGGAVCWGPGALTLGAASYDECPDGVCAVPVPVDGEHRFTDIAVGISHTCAVDDEGRAYCWGFSNNGAIGNCEITPEWPSPQLVCGETRYVSITVGRDHSCGVSPDGEGWCWGSNEVFQLGSTSFTSFGPRQVVPARPERP